MLSSPAWSQGYLGERLILRLQGSGSFNLSQVLVGQQVRVQGAPALGAEFVFSRRLSLQSSLAPYRIQTFYQYEGNSGLLGLQGQTLDLSLKFYSYLRRGNLAPVGPYQAFSLITLRQVANDPERNHSPDDRAALGIYYDLALAFSLGNQWIIQDRLAIDLSLQAGWPLNWQRGMVGTDREKFLLDLMASRMRRFLLLNAQIGIGLLIPNG